MLLHQHESLQLTYNQPENLVAGENQASNYPNTFN